jgi:hypothetical protein
MAWDCSAFFDFLFDQSPHFDKDILKDWFPTDDAWIGHVMTIPWESFTGTTHVYDHVHVGAPDLSQAWDRFDTQSTDCVSNACTPRAISVGWGSTRKTYDRERKRYETNVLCFDQMNTRAKAKQQLAEIIRGIKDLTKMIWSDYIRRSSLMLAETLFIAGAARTEVPITSTMFTGGMATIRLGSDALYPTSTLTIQYLQRFYEPLQGNGYFKSKYVPNGVFKLITDPISTQQLIEMNPTLIGGFKFTDFQKGGELFKYGMSKAIGNFGIAWDNFPARFYPLNDGFGGLLRVWPYVNTPATIGIKPTLNQQWVDAPIQYSAIWHPEALKRAVPDLTSVHPEMPFLTRDLGGKWNFSGPQSDTLVVTDPNTGDTCVIDNKARNQGLWWADFEAGFKFEYPEWVRPILHLREPGCVIDNPVCSTAPDYVTQSYDDVNPVCEEIV